LSGDNEQDRAAEQATGTVARGRIIESAAAPTGMVECAGVPRDNDSHCAARRRFKRAGHPPAGRYGLYRPEIR